MTGTIAPIMSTDIKTDQLGITLFGKTRRAILALLYGRVDESFYLRQLARSVNAGMGAVQRELKALSEAGIIRRHVQGRHVYYQADPRSPVFKELRSLVAKTVGAGDILRDALAPLADRIDLAFIYGSVARAEEKKNSDVDVLIVGNVTFSEIVSALNPAQKILGREINPAVYPPAEFRSKVIAGHHFLTAVLGGEKLYLIGGKDELERLVKKRVGGRTQIKSSGNL